MEVSAERLVVAEGFGAETEHGFPSSGGPEFLGPFDTPADLFDRRFHEATGKRQALAAIAGVIHPCGVVFVIDQRRADHFARVVTAGILRGRPEFFRVSGQFVDHVLYVSLPDFRRPVIVDVLRCRFAAADGASCREAVGEGV